MTYYSALGRVSRPPISGCLPWFVIHNQGEGKGAVPGALSGFCIYFLLAVPCSLLGAGH